MLLSHEHSLLVYSFPTDAGFRVKQIIGKAVLREKKERLKSLKLKSDTSVLEIKCWGDLTAKILRIKCDTIWVHPETQLYHGKLTRTVELSNLCSFGT